MTSGGGNSTKRRRTMEEVGIKMDDEVEEILSRLPVKDVLRCKLLNKACYDLIQSPRFINSHLLNRSRSDNKLVLVTKNLHNNAVHRMISTTLESSEVLFAPTPSPCCGCSTLVGSCNGLLVLLSLPDDLDLKVCNPATKDYFQLARPSLVHDDTDSYHLDALGFGYDPSSADYKMVRFGDYSAKNKTGLYLAEIWTMSSNTWKQITHPALPPPLLKKDYHIKHYFGLLVNGILYLLALCKDKKGYRDPDALILISFDPRTDAFGQIPLPRESFHHHDLGHLNLIDFMGSLALCVGGLPYDCHRFFDIWVMGSDSLWTKRFSIGPFPLGVSALRVCINGNFVLLRVLEDGCSQFILYDPRRNKVQRETRVGILRGHMTTWSYTESLVSLPTQLHNLNEDD